MRGSRTFCQSVNVFYLIRGGRIKIPLQAGHHQMAFRWRADDDQTLNAGLEVLCFLCTPKKLVSGCILGWQIVAYHFRVTVTLTSDLVFRIIVSGAFLLYHLR